MESPACNIIYVNRNVGPERLIRAKTQESSSGDWQADEARTLVQPLLDAFGDVHVCASGLTCVEKIFELHDRSMLDTKPTIVLFDTPRNDYIKERRWASSRSPSPTSDIPASADETQTPDEELYGLNLLQKLITEAHLRNIAKLVVPIPIISHPQEEELLVSAGSQMTDGAHEHIPTPSTGLAANRDIIRRCLELGAADVLVSPLSFNCIATLEICAFRAQRDAAREHQTLLEIRRGRQRSWVGISDEKPFAYLREAMVSGLMKGICRTGPEQEHLNSVHVAVSSARQAEIAEAVAHWHFSAHMYTDDELVVATMVMFKHAINMPELEKWRISTDQLISFLVACRGAYNSFVPYHNFRHVVDVLQATFNFLVHISALAPYPPKSGDLAGFPGPKSPIGSLITPFEALTLLVTAIGHDVGHPGVNNGFLVTLNAPLAQLYNDRSVLESFHCAAFSQILRRYWPAAFEDAKMRNLMISSILATDMGLHFDYMKKLGDAQEKLQANNTTDGWNGRQIEEQKALACSLLIKCADISNVARGHDAALKWMHILSEEFSRQASMEDELDIRSSLMAPPKKDISSLVKAQLGFMNLFAIPLFQGVADIMPGMKYTVDELELNKRRFESMMEEEMAKEGGQEDASKKRSFKEGALSPRTMSYAVGMEEDNKDSTNQKGGKPGNMMEGISEVLATTPSVLIEEGEHEEEALDPIPSDPARKPSHIPQSHEEYKDVNGKISSFDAVRQLANSDPFNSQGGAGGPGPGTSMRTDDSSTPPARQRCSETTEDSTSAGLMGDWASQATSAATGKMPMSPSTKGTSIVSKESGDRPASAPGPQRSHKGSRDQGHRAAGAGIDDKNGSTTTGSLGKAEGKTALRKKSSRFRMKDFPFFRRHKGSSTQATDTAG